MALAVTIPADRPARAADDCSSAPNSQPPPGTHWYYHLDRTKNRKCWYVAPFGQKVHALRPATTAPQPAARDAQSAPALAAPATETAGDRMTPRVEQTTAPTWPATTAGDAAQGAAFAARWVDEPKPADVFAAAQAATSAPAPNSAGPRLDLPRAAIATARETSASRAPIAQEQDAMDVQDTDIRDDAPAPVASEAAATLTPARMLLLVASALAVSGMLLREIFHIPPARRRRRDLDRRDLEQREHLTREWTSPRFDAGRSRPPIAQPNARRDAEATLREIMRRAAQADERLKAG
jgi:hypothetical protein